MPFSVALDSSISLNDLVHRSRTTGAMIVRTPHVGNVTGHTLGLAALGLRLLLYDRTLGQRDISCHPHLIIAGGESEQIGDPTVLTTHARVVTPSRRAAARVGTPITAVHLAPLRRAYPERQWTTYTDFVRGHADAVLPILAAATRAMPSLWRRRVDAHGVVERGEIASWDDLTRDGVYGVTSQSSGWLIPNELNVLLTCTVETAGRDVDWALLMAGVDMIRYMTAYESLLGHLYDVVRTREPDLKLPEQFRCVVSPVYRVRFHITEREQWLLDEMLSIYERILRENAAIRTEIRTGSHESPAASLITARQRSIGALHDLFAAHGDALAWHTFYDSRDAAYFTQHDLGEGERVRIHPWAVQASVAENHDAYHFLHRHYQYVRRMTSRRQQPRQSLMHDVRQDLTGGAEA